ncbi:hypothetical protein U1Q18_027534, partial [Sarracenia purpurea var. burkii]
YPYNSTASPLTTTHPSLYPIPTIVENSAPIHSAPVNSAPVHSAPVNTGTSVSASSIPTNVPESGSVQAIGSPLTVMGSEPISAPTLPLTLNISNPSRVTNYVTHPIPINAISIHLPLIPPPYHNSHLNLTRSKIQCLPSQHSAALLFLYSHSLDACEPSTHKEALTNPHWLKAMQEEFTGLIENKT